MLNQSRMEEMSDVMKHQFTMNQHRNIFCDTKQLFFHEVTKTNVARIRTYINELSKDQLHQQAYLYQKRFLEQFYQVNQYTYFDETSLYHIRTLYQVLLGELANPSISLMEIETNHFQRIKNVIKYSNPAIYQINHNANQIARQFVCAQYSGTFLCKLFNITEMDIEGPVLDIGCGRDANLVTHLRSMKVEAYGIDRETMANGCYSIDWFAFDYGIERWKHIISNLSFTSHFLYHHLHQEAIADQYAATYMDILQSLQKQGKWMYAPSIPFFEDLLPKQLYQIKRRRIHDDFSETIITKR